MKKKKSTILLLIVVVILSLAVIAVTIAYMFRNSGEVDNEFSKAEVMCSVVETFDEETGVKSSVKVRNTGNITEFIRVRLISYWMDAEGNIVGKPSEMPEVSYDTDKWIEGTGDTYYCKTSVIVGEETPEFLKESIQLKYPPDEDYYQVLEIISEAIQAAPGTAAAESWGVTFEDGKIKTAP